MYDIRRLNCEDVPIRQDTAVSSLKFHDIHLFKWKLKTFRFNTKKNHFVLENSRSTIITIVTNYTHYKNRTICLQIFIKVI